MIFGRYKAVKPNLKKTPNRIEIYDLESDPGEKTDLATKRPDLIQRALRVLQSEHVMNPNFPLPGVDVESR